ARGRTLVVAPTSVLVAWKEQLSRFRPRLSISLFSGSSRVFDEKAHVVLTSYGILRQEIERLAEAGWDLVVLDESQTIKNPDSQVARAAHSIRSFARIAMSGTPIENRKEDLWSQFQFLNPGLLG